MRKSLLLLIITSLLITSCKKEQQKIISETSNSTLFEKDEALLELIKMNTILVSKMSPLSDSDKALLTKKDLTPVEKNKIANSLGFNNINECDLFFKRQSEIINSIIHNYPEVKKISHEKIKSIVENAVNISHQNRIKTNRMDNRCTDIFNNCIDQAITNYTINILECTAAAMGVGSLTLGVGGVIFQLACGGAALRNLNLVQTGCGLSYSNCR
jgi:hypothetical protein